MAVTQSTKQHKFLFKLDYSLSLIRRFFIWCTTNALKPSFLSKLATAACHCCAPQPQPQKKRINKNIIAFDLFTNPSPHTFIIRSFTCIHQAQQQQYDEKHTQFSTTRYRESCSSSQTDVPMCVIIKPSSTHTHKEKSPFHTKVVKNWLMYGGVKKGNCNHLYLLP